MEYAGNFRGKNKTLLVFCYGIVLASFFVSDVLSSESETDKQIGEGKIICYPRIVSIDDQISIEMNENHPSEFAVVRPDGEFFFISYKKYDVNSVLRSPIENSLFLSLVSFRFSLSRFVGHRWREGTKEYENIFDQRGIYTFLLGDNLETDTLDNTFRCEIELTY